MKKRLAKRSEKMHLQRRMFSALMMMVLMFSSMEAHAKTYTISELNLQQKLPYDTVTHIGEGFYKVTKKSSTGEEMWGIINSDLKIVAPLSKTKYDFMGKVSEGLIRVGNNTDGDKKTGPDSGPERGIDQYGFIDTAGELVIPLEFEHAEDFSEGRARIYEYYEYEWTKDDIFKGTMVTGTRVGFIDKTGTIVIPAIYDPPYSTTSDLSWGFSDGLACVRKDDKWGAIDYNGNIIVPFVYSHMYPFSEGLAAVKQNGKTGFVDTSGKLVIPCSFSVSSGHPGFKEGRIIVCKETRDKQGNLITLYGAIDRTGTLVVPTIYDSLRDFSEGIAVFGKGKTYGEIKYGFVDSTGKEISSAVYDFVGDFSEGLARVGITTEDARHPSECKWGYIDKTGKMTIPMEYDDAEDFSEGVAVIGCAVPGKWKDVYGASYKVKTYGVIDKNGAAVISPTLNSATNSINGILHVTTKEGEKATRIKNPLYEEYLQNSVSATIPMEPVRAVPTSSSILVDGKVVSFEGYNINGSNYFKLRDLAKVLTGTIKQFEVSWDNTAKAIQLISGKPYTVVGGELTQGDGTAKVALPTVSPIYLNGEKISLIAYNINGNNYFKLRDVGQAFDFDVSWDNVTKTITVDTSKSYTAD